MHSAKVLYITYDGLTDPLGQSQILPYFIYLANKGLEIFVVSAEKKIPFLERGKDIKKQIKKYNIHWYPINYTKNPPILSTIRDLKKIYSTALSIMQEEKPQIIHTRSYLPQQVAIKLKKHFPATKLLFDIRGFWIDERIEGGIWPNKHIYKVIYKYLKTKEPELYINANHIISLTYKGKQIVSEQFNIPLQKISVIPCAASQPPLLSANQKEEIKQQLKIESNYPIFTYVGSSGTWYMTEEIVKFFAIVLKKYPNALLLWFGNVNKKELIKHDKTGLLSPNNIIVKYIPHSELLSLLPVADVGIFFIKPLWSKNASSPTKMGEMLAAGLPIIANDIGDVGKIIEETNCGILIKEFNTFHYESVVENLDRIIKTDKDNIKNAYTKYFSFDIAAQKYLTIYKNLIK